jgi:hypothetical protein
MSSEPNKSKKVVAFARNKIRNIWIDCLKNTDDEKKTVATDENNTNVEESSQDKRETWTGRFDFFLSALAYAGW